MYSSRDKELFSPNDSECISEEIRKDNVSVYQKNPVLGHRSSNETKNIVREQWNAQWLPSQVRYCSICLGWRNPLLFKRQALIERIGSSTTSGAPPMSMICLGSIITDATTVITILAVSTCTSKVTDISTRGLCLVLVGRPRGRTTVRIFGDLARLSYR